MSETLDDQPQPRRRAQLLSNLDRMVEVGRVTAAEAERLRAAAEQGDFDDMAMGIRRRHATAAVEAAVEDGTMTREEADAILERLESGEDPHFLRGLRRRLRPGPRRPASPHTDRTSTTNDAEQA